MRTPRGLTALAGLALAMGLVGACGDDAEEAYCEARDSLGANIEGLGDVDIVADGTAALDEQFSAISGDIDQLKESGPEVAAQEIEALEAAADRLGTALDDLGADITVDGARETVTATGGVLEAAVAVLDRLATACE